MLNSKMLATLCFLSAFAATPAMAADAYISAGQLRVDPGIGLKDVSLSVSGPNGFTAHIPADATSLRVNLMQDGVLADGVYRWRIRGTTNKRLNPGGNRAQTAIGGEQELAGPLYETKVESGIIRVVNGQARLPDTSAVEN